jgi:D-alanine-D-alanine ligase
METKGIAIFLHNKVYDDSPEDVLDIDRQVRWLADITENFGYTVIKLPFSPESLIIVKQLNENSPVLVVNLVDSAPGEEKLSYLGAGILEYLKVKFTGNTFEALYSTTDKILAKTKLRDAGIPTPEWIYGNERRGFIAGEKYIVKVLGEDSSIGLADKSVVVADSLDELENIMEGREKEIGEKVFAERYIDGREFNVCIYGDRSSPIVLPPYEWVFDGFEKVNKVKIINYDAKWTENTFEYDHVKPVYGFSEQDEALLEELTEISAKCWNEFGLRGYARIDFRIDSDGKPWVLEINCNPSLYGYRNIAREKGLNFNDIFKAIIEAK